MKDFIKVVVGFLGFLILGVLASILIRDLTRQPSVILSDTRCAPPCWAGITPGQTNSNDAYSILGEISGVDEDGILLNYDRDDTLTSLQWIFLRPLPDNLGTLHFEQDLVTAVDILTVNSLTLEEAVERLGEPALLWSRIGSGDNREYLDVYLVNPAAGYRLELVLDIPQGASEVELKAAAGVFSVLYFDPQSFQHLLDTGILINTPGHSFPGDFQAWPGYGTLPVIRE
jgi:hypothetical protein